MSLLSAAKANGVKAATVNVMAMDYGPACAGDMGTYAEQAATATQAQAKSATRRRFREVEGSRPAVDAIGQMIKKTIKKTIKECGRM